MDRGIYAAASGGLVNERRIQVVSNNLANASTAGFKEERLVTQQQSFEDTLSSKLPQLSPRAEGDQERTPGVINATSVTDFSIGPISTTGDPLNVAIGGPNQFFAVNTPDGEQYTRAGNFTLNETGTLVTVDGQPVLGDGGPITLPPGKVEISSSGTVTVNNEQVGQLRVVEIDDLKALKRVGHTRFAIEGGAKPTNVRPNLITESLEMPNISVVSAMVELVSAGRSFEAYTKTIRTIDELNEQAIRNAQTTG